jgi:hypothetical protein
VLLLVQLRRVINIDRGRRGSALERVFAGHPLPVVADSGRRNFMRGSQELVDIEIDVSHISAPLQAAH